MCCGRSHFRARGSPEARPGRTCAARREADFQLYFGCTGLLRFHAPSLPRLRVLAGLHFPRIPLTHPQPAIHPQPQSSMHPPLLWQTPHHPYSALHSLTPPNRIFTHTSHQPHPTSRRCSLTHTTNSPPLCARHRGHYQAGFWSSNLTDDDGF